MLKYLSNDYCWIELKTERSIKQAVEKFTNIIIDEVEWCCSKRAKDKFVYIDPFSEDVYQKIVLMIHSDAEKAAFSCRESALDI